MKYSRSIMLILPSSICLLLICLFGEVNGFAVVLDTAKDLVRSMWKVKGFVEYVERGSVLRGPFSQYFPDRFDFAHLDSAEGVWVVIPDFAQQCPAVSPIDGNKLRLSDNKEKGSNEIDVTGNSAASAPSLKTICSTSPNATFQFTFRAQLLESATIRYCFGGDAVIRVGNSEDDHFDILANKNRLNNWVEEKVPLSGRSLILSALVFGKGDYILIDKITVESMEATTPRPPQTTTEVPTTTLKPIPRSGQAGTAPPSIPFVLFLLPINVMMVSLILKQI